ncbi:MAG: hypothetical protein GY814_11215 [Gammaproteobacteria bacterium]|nr:hypothetical protein [Gammaproteobacteria bacterium]
MEVARRWKQLFSGHPLVDRFVRGEALSGAEQKLVAGLSPACNSDSA